MGLAQLRHFAVSKMIISFLTASREDCSRENGKNSQMVSVSTRIGNTSLFPEYIGRKTG
jgi:hypothetical protein